MRFFILICCLFCSVQTAQAYTFTASGKFVYEDKEWDFSGWTGQISQKPIRKAAVNIRRLSNNTIIGSGYTQDDGTFQIAITTSALILGNLRAELESSTDSYNEQADNNFPKISVKNDGATVAYLLLSKEIPDQDATNNADFGTTVSLIAIYGGAEGNVFNVFDMAVDAWDYITGPVIHAPPKGPYKIVYPYYWSSGVDGMVAYIADDDGYDDSVILHEIGHVVQHSYSDDDSPGGMHYFGDSDQDPRLSFSEGYATFFSSTILMEMGKPGIYVDIDEFNKIELRTRLEDGYPYTDKLSGAADELAVAASLYDLLDTEATPDDTPGYDDDGFTLNTEFGIDIPPAWAWWDTFTGPIKQASNCTVNDVWDGWFKEAPIQYAHYYELRDIFDHWKMQFYQTDPEPSPLHPVIIDPPVSTSLDWGPIETLYQYPDVNTLVPGNGDIDTFQVYLNDGDTFVVETRYPDGNLNAGTDVDPKMSLINPQGNTVASDQDSGFGRNAAIIFTAKQDGYFKVKVSRQNPSLRPYGSYQLGYRIDGIPKIPAGGKRAAQHP